MAGSSKRSKGTIWMAGPPWQSRSSQDGKGYGATFEDLSMWTFHRKQQMLAELELSRRKTELEKAINDARTAAHNGTTRFREVCEKDTNICVCKLCMHIFLYVYTYLLVNICETHAHVNVYLHTYASTCTHTSIGIYNNCTNVFISLCVCAYTYICIYMYMYRYVYIYIFIYTYICMHT